MIYLKKSWLKVVLFSLFSVGFLHAQQSPDHFWGLDFLNIDQQDGSTNYSVNIQLLLFFTALSVLPSLVLMVTSFARIVIVLSMLRQALGLPSTPNNQIIVGMSLFLTFFIMSDIFEMSYENGLEPYQNGQISLEEAWDKSVEPFRTFMSDQVRSNDLSLFMELSNTPFEEGTPIPLKVLVPAYMTSELKTAFQIGFLIFIPFLVIDMVVSSVLMAMGMMMLSPLVISLPFKIMLFVLVDGWNLLLGSLARSFIGGG